MYHCTKSEEILSSAQISPLQISSMAQKIQVNSVIMTKLVTVFITYPPKLWNGIFNKSEKATEDMKVFIRYLYILFL